MRKLRQITALVLSHGEAVHWHQSCRSTRWGGTYTANQLIPTSLLIAKLLGLVVIVDLSLY